MSYALPGSIRRERRLEVNVTQEDIANVVAFEPISAAELHERYRFECGVATVSRNLAACFKAGVLDRRWEGGQRFGRYVYFRREEGGAK